MENWEHIKPIRRQHMSLCVGCFLDPRQNWKSTQNSHPSTEKADKGMEGGKQFPLLSWVSEKLGGDGVRKLLEKLFVFFSIRPSWCDCGSGKNMSKDWDRKQQNKKPQKQQWQMRLLSQTVRPNMMRKLDGSESKAFYMSLLSSSYHLQSNWLMWSPSAEMNWDISHSEIENLSREIVDNLITNHEWFHWRLRQKW